MLETSHFSMVNVGEKPYTQRTAWAEGLLRMKPTTLAQVEKKQLAKGDALKLAEIAGLLAAKKTAELIPLCHPLPLDFAEVTCVCCPEQSVIRVQSEVRAYWKTGVEMEALTAVQVALLTLYDVIKQVDPELDIDSVRLRKKIGGKSQVWVRQ